MVVGRKASFEAWQAYMGVGHMAWPLAWEVGHTAVGHMEPSLASWVEGQHNTKVQKQEHRLGSNRKEGVVGLCICSRQGVHCNKSHDRPEHRLSHNRQDTSEVVVQGQPQRQWQVERRFRWHCLLLLQLGLVAVLALVVAFVVVPSCRRYRYRSNLVDLPLVVVLGQVVDLELGLVRHHHLHHHLQLGLGWLVVGLGHRQQHHHLGLVRYLLRHLQLLLRHLQHLLLGLVHLHQHLLLLHQLLGDHQLSCV